MLNYQGRIAVAGVNFEGTGNFKFAFVDGTGAETFWSNDGTSAAGSEPAAAVALAVSKGLYSVLLGDTALTNMTPIPASVFSHPDVRLRVWFSDGTATGFQLLSPDQRIAAVGYAMVAGGVPDGSITSAKIAAGAVGSTQIASGAVTSAQIVAGGVGAAQLAPNAVTATHIGAGQVVKSLNGLSDSVTFTAGENVTLTSAGNNLTLAAPLTGGSATFDSLTARGPVTLPDVPLYLLTAHANLSGGTRLAFGLSRDGIHFNRIGALNPYTLPVPADSPRDPVAIYYPPTKEFLIAYTHVQASAASGFATTLGLCKTRDFQTVEFVGEIPINGTGLGASFDTTWIGAWLVDGGHYYLTLLPRNSGGVWNQPGVGWIRCNNPGRVDELDGFHPVHRHESGLGNAGAFERPHDHQGRRHLSSFRGWRGHARQRLRHPARHEHFAAYRLLRALPRDRRERQRPVGGADRDAAPSWWLADVSAACLWKDALLGFRRSGDVDLWRRDWLAGGKLGG